jgi:hypothetical protein
METGSMAGLFLGESEIGHRAVDFFINKQRPMQNSGCLHPSQASGFAVHGKPEAA